MSNNLKEKTETIVETTKETFVAEIKSTEEATKKVLKAGMDAPEEKEDEKNESLIIADNVEFADEEQKKRLSRLMTYIEKMKPNMPITPEIARSQHQNLFNFLSFILLQPLTNDNTLADIRLTGKIIRLHKDGCFSDIRIRRYWSAFQPKNRKLRDEASLLFAVFVRLSINGRRSKPINWSNFKAIVRPVNAEKFGAALREAFNVK